MTITKAKESEKEEILALYRTHLYGPAAWDEHYPSMKTIEFDLSRDALFVTKDQAGKIVSTISIDQDPSVEELTCWSRELQPSEEFSRVCVREDMQGKGIASCMVADMLELLKSRGNKSAHILVKTQNHGAMRLYERLGFEAVGDCVIDGRTFICMEYSFISV